LKSANTIDTEIDLSSPEQMITTTRTTRTMIQVMILIKADSQMLEPTKTTGQSTITTIMGQALMTAMTTMETVKIGELN
jgi:gamma-glutamylcysteine synthetase